MNNTKTTSQSLDRQWKILSKLRVGRWVGTTQLKEMLKKEGIDISLRTIQRDLNQLAKRFPIESDHSVPQGWRWQQHADMSGFPIMSSTQAVTFLMVEDYLKHLLPPSMLDELAPWFRQAKQNLQSEQNAFSDWFKHVKMVPATQPLIPPTINKKCQHRIYEALLTQTQIDAFYQKRTAQSTPKQTLAYKLNPIAIVQRGAILYLLATKADSPTVLRQFAMHRFVSVENTHFAIEQPEGFDLDAYIKTGKLDYWFDDLEQGTPTSITLHFAEHAGDSLLEAQLSSDQQTQWINESILEVTATVPLTQQLAWWLRGFGKRLVKIEPAKLADFVWETHPTTEES